MSRMSLIAGLLLVSGLTPAWSGPVLAAPRAAAAPVPAVSPLARLSFVVQGALSQTPLVSPSLVSALPLNSLTTVKAQLLVERAAVLAPAVPFGQGERQAASAQEVLAAVNSVLQDIPEERLRSMPKEELHGLAGLIMDQLADRRQEARPPVEAIALLSQASLGRIEALRKKSLTETPLNPYPEERMPDIRRMSGVPPEVRALKADEKSVVFRHYTTPEGLQAILKSARLRNGAASYVLGLAHNVWKLFDDLTGIFLTLPGVDGAKVGVSKSPVYVDLKVPAGLPILEIENGRIYLIPMPRRAKAPIVERFLRWLKGESVPSYEEKDLKELDGQGGPGPALSVPIEIVGYGPR